MSTAPPTPMHLPTHARKRERERERERDERKIQGHAGRERERVS